MKKFLKKRLPGPEIITGNRYLSFLAPWLDHPRLWHMHRRAVALGVSIGLVTGLIPGPIQIVLAVLIAIPLRANVIAAAAATLYTNPFTFVPLYLLAYQVGAFVTGTSAQAAAIVPPEFEWSLARIWEAIPAWFQWMLSLGDTLLIGLLIQASAFAVLGYITIMIAWRVTVTRMWRNRHAKMRP